MVIRLDKCGDEFGMQTVKKPIRYKIGFFFCRAPGGTCFCPITPKID